tara:strand:+ start:65 stop:742 length:678 start_codon:yes stop_codon:yes gene_type:complete
MGIKNKNTNPKPTDFNKNDIVINVKDGILFFKTANNALIKVDPRDWSVSPEVINNITNTYITNEGDTNQTITYNLPEIAKSQLYHTRGAYDGGDQTSWKYLPFGPLASHLMSEATYATSNVEIYPPYGGIFKKLFFYYKNTESPYTSNPGTVDIQLRLGSNQFDQQLTNVTYSTWKSVAFVESFNAGDDISVRIKASYPDNYEGTINIYASVEIEYDYESVDVGG